MSYSETLEELGSVDAACLEIEIEYDMHHGAPSTQWEPGYGPQVEIWGAHVKEYLNETEHIKREDRPDWFQLLDKIALNYVQKNNDKYEEYILDAEAEESWSRFVDDYYGG